MLDEGLAILDGLWSGERFSYAGQHFTVDPARFTPAPVQRPRVPVWVGGVLPATRPIARAARWDGVVPIRFAERSLIRPSAADIAGVRERVTAVRGSVDGFDVVVWAEVAAQPGEVPALAPPIRRPARPGGSRPPSRSRSGGRGSPGGPMTSRSSRGW